MLFQRCSLEAYFGHVEPVMCAAHASVFQRELVEVCPLGWDVGVSMTDGWSSESHSNETLQVR